MTIGCDTTEKRVCWWDDRAELVTYARWLYGRKYLYGGADMLDFFADPLAWQRTRLSGDLRVEYEAEGESE